MMKMIAGVTDPCRRHPDEPLERRRGLTRRAPRSGMPLPALIRDAGCGGR
ncbi:hypothetical protein [Nonomuraea terrae]|nr:hypothetical protein [Nonomuraea terrae]